MQRITLAAALLAVSGAAVAGDFDFDPGSTQQDFALITKDLTGGLNFKSLHPAETNGITGIGVGVTTGSSDPGLDSGREPRHATTAETAPAIATRKSSCSRFAPTATAR